MARSAVSIQTRLPNVAIVGVSRGGTTSLFRYLGHHPDVGTSDVKEVRYFSSLRYGEQLAPLESYAAHFSHCTEPYVLEATPGYFSGGAKVAQAMRQTLPGLRTVVSLRAPADRCWSWFQFVKSRTRIPRDMTFDAYLDRCEQLHDAGTDATFENQPYWGLGGGCYDTWLDDWLEVFGADFRVVFFDDVVADPLATVGDICSWLGMDASALDTQAFNVNNKAEQYRHRRLQQMALALNRRGEHFFHRHERAKRLLRQAYYSVNRAPAEPTMSASARARVTDFYRPHTANLAKQLANVGVTLPPSWAAQH
ncbi:MAG: sulfotransferase [Actinomycetota bacterium]|nr:sulfotransferase [Actinomycetota bacterium]